VILLRRNLRAGPLVRGWLAGSPEAATFFPGDPSDGRLYQEVAESLSSRFDRERRERVAMALSGGGEGREARLASFVEEEGYVVMTGQQPGLFGGPLLALYKGATAVALARRLELLLRRPVLPVFWIASEDHDWEEVRGIDLLDPQNQPCRISLEQGEPNRSPPLHRLVLGPEIHGAVESFLSLHPETEYLPEWRALLRLSYREGTTLPSAFESLMSGLFEGEGLFFLQAHQSLLKLDSVPLLVRELEADGSEEEALAQGIEAAGFELQVPVLPGATNLFFEGGHGRERIFREGEGYRLRHSGDHLSREAIVAAASDDPTLLSPNVLLRPVVESAFLPSLAYVAGPGEAAYLPQSRAAFLRHGLTPPPIHPRLSCTVLEGKIAKILTKFGLELEDLNHPEQEIAARLMREQLPEEVRATLEQLRGEIEGGAVRLTQAIRGIDPTLSGPIETFRAQGVHHLAEVERKMVQALKRENEIALSQVAKATQHLFPLGTAQERVLNPVYYLVRYGDAFLQEVWGAAREAVLP